MRRFADSSSTAVAVPLVSLRLGHARALTPPRGVIHSPRAASLPTGEGGTRRVPDEVSQRKANPCRGELCSPDQVGLTLASLSVFICFANREVAREARRRDCKKQKAITRQSLTAYGGAPFTQGSLFSYGTNVRLPPGGSCRANARLKESACRIKCAQIPKSRRLLPPLTREPPKLGKLVSGNPAAVPLPLGGRLKLVSRLGRANTVRPYTG